MMSTLHPTPPVLAAPAGLTPLTLAAFTNGVQRMKVLLKHGEHCARGGQAVRMGGGACWVVGCSASSECMPACLVG
jgi:hypothetical protein